MKCMKKVALEFDETKINREPSGSSKGRQFTSKNGGSTQHGRQEKPSDKKQKSVDTTAA